MAYDIQFPLPAGWTVEQESFEDESGAIITHAEAHLRNDSKQSDDGLIDIYVGDMPDGETAEDQAFANYAEVVGFDEDDEDVNPISKWKFNGRNAWGFDAFCEDDSPMRFIATEVRKGVLAIIVAAAPDADALDGICSLAERSLRVK